MKRLSFSMLALLLLFVAACDDKKSETDSESTDSDTTEAASVSLVLKNKIALDQTDAPVVLSREQLSSLSPELPEGQSLKISAAGEVLPSQMDDLDGDGAWDEVAFLANVPGQAELEVSLEWVESLPEFTDRAEVYFGVSANNDTSYTSVTEETRPKEHKVGDYGRYQMEGPSWGNDIVAFRTYFDTRNGRDIFGKRTPELHLSKTGLLNAEGGHSYHDLHDWEMDVLKVANSLGAGALAVMHKGEPYRLGETDKAQWKKITDGPVRAIMELRYEGWKVGESTLNLSDQIVMWAGKPYYTSNVNLEGNTEGKYLVTGIVNKKTKKEYIKLDIADQYAAIYTHDTQSEIEDNLGMGLLVDQSKLVAFAEAPHDAPEDKVGHTYFAQLKSEGTVTYRFFVGWEKQNPKYKEAAYFEKTIKEEGQKLASPLEIMKLEGDTKVAL